jgi:uncharacterized protein (DUF2252 family)
MKFRRGAIAKRRVASFSLHGVAHRLPIRENRRALPPTLHRRGPAPEEARAGGDVNEVLARIERFNRGRDPKLLKRKYRAMRDNAFAFLRGSTHLFYESLPDDALLRDAPAAWTCGDLHLENVGAYKGDNRQVYFDIADFDEAALAPCTWDVLRFAVSILVGARSLGLKRAVRHELCRCFIDAYGDALADGKARWVERETATGMTLEILEAVRERRRKDLLDERTVCRGKRRKLVIDGSRAVRAVGGQKKRILHFMREFAKLQEDPRFFRPIAVARRIAGLGSLGLERYVILVRGKGSPDGNYLLDLKHEPAPAIRRHLPITQPRWRSEADRVVTVQRRVQAIAPAFLRALRIDGRPFVLKELQPGSDRIYLARWGKKVDRLEQLCRTAGEIVAWGQLRSSGRGGSAHADALTAFARRKRWRAELLRLAGEAGESVVADWKRFRRTSP